MAACQGSPEQPTARLLPPGFSPTARTLPGRAGQGKASKAEMSWQEGMLGQSRGSWAPVLPLPQSLPLADARTPQSNWKGERCLVSGCEVGETQGRSTPHGHRRAGSGTLRLGRSFRAADPSLLPLQLYPARRGHGEPQDSPPDGSAAGMGRQGAQPGPGPQRGSPDCPPASLVYMSCHLQSALQGHKRGPCPPPKLSGANLRACGPGLVSPPNPTIAWAGSSGREENLWGTREDWDEEMNRSPGWPLSRTSPCSGLCLRSQRKNKAAGLGAEGDPSPEGSPGPWVLGVLGQKWRRGVDFRNPLCCTSQQHVWSGATERTQ